MAMDKLRSLGRCFFAAAMVGFAVQHLMYAHLRTGIGNPWTPQSSFWAYLTGVILLLAATLLILGRQVSTAAAFIAAVCFLAAIVLHAPGLIAKVRDPGPWTSGAELLALCGVALVLMGTTLTGDTRDSSPLLIESGRDLFAITLPVFGVQHFIYAHFVSTIVPAWMPFRLFWAYFVGAAFIAAALAIVTHIQGRLASTLLGVMFLIWVVILHLPRIVASHHNGNEWTSGFVALAMSGGAFIGSSTFRRAA
jgi:uncharacterized membrane protein